jgi:hypothetical protein
MSGKIYIITNGDQRLSSNLEIFSSKESAKRRLKELANERRGQFSVRDLEETEESFSYLFGGWEEKLVHFYIREFDIDKGE